MDKKKFLVEKLKNRILHSLNERNNPTGKRGEEWFYKPFNNCIRNLQSREPNMKLEGENACYERVNGDRVCLVARFSGNEKGGYVLTPSFVMKYIKNGTPIGPIGLYKYIVYGEWWCESGKKEPIIDLTKTIEHRKRMADKEKNEKNQTNKEYFDGVTKNTNTSSLIPQAKTMDDVKNKKGYIIKGMRGPMVKELQQMLINLGYDLGPTKDDSIVGDKTFDAVVDFQK